MNEFLSSPLLSIWKLLEFSFKFGEIFAIFDWLSTIVYSGELILPILFTSENITTRPSFTVGTHKCFEFLQKLWPAVVMSTWHSRKVITLRPGALLEISFLFFNSSTPINLHIIFVTGEEDITRIDSRRNKNLTHILLIFHLFIKKVYILPMPISIMWHCL